MRFRILGPIEVDAGEGSLGLGGPKQRAVLAHLVIRANQVVPSTSLIDQLWGDEPPETAKNTLQTYVSHLRKVVGAERLTARAPGYQLSIGPDELDVTRFDALVDEARVARPSDARLAFAALDDALGLWRGPALADVLDDGSLTAEATRLDELRLSAEEERLELLLELGEPARAAGELEALIARNPLREGCWGLLMLALYRSERQADALAAYGRARSILADELGIDPSPELVRLHERILRQDPTLELKGEALRGYRLLERIGQGANSVIFRGVQPNVGRDVAVKVFQQEMASDPSFIRRFEPEAQAVAALEHPHIAPVYDYWREPEGAYVVSRFLPAGSLAGLEARGESLEPAAAGRIVQQVRSALDFAHRRGVVHGDLTPSNILMDGDGNAYLTDFRIAVGAPADPADDLRALDAIAGRLLPASDGRVGARTFPAGSGLTPGDIEEARNPYKGLRAFGEPDAQDFFGRGALVGRILGRLAEAQAGARFLAVVGPSGCGKSSVVRAGVLPAIRGGALGGSDRWFVAEMLPGPHPIEELEAALLRIAARPVPRLLDLLEARPRGLLESIDLVAPGDSEVLLVVDQFEETFTLAAQEPERALFLESLRVATADPSSRLRVVVTLRADFYDRPLLYPRFGDLLGGRTEVVPPLTPDELELAITGPARSVGVTAEAGLAAELIADVAHQVGALPLLQYALTELFERRDGAWLTLAAYRDIGGVAGALSARAERLYEASDAAGRTTTKQIFLRLVTLGEGRPDTRRRVTRSDLDAIGVDPGSIDSALSTFGRHRLLTFDREPSTREPTVEIAHEALLTEWTRLRSWVDEGRDDLRQERRMVRAAAEWRTSGHDPSFLLQGARLAQLEAWSAVTTLTVGPTERAYLKASLDRRGELATEEEARRAQTARLERRSVTRMRWLVAVLTAAALVASLLSVVAVRQRSRALAAGRVATVRELAAAAMANLSVDPQRSVLLALEAVKESGTGGVLQEAAQALHSAIAADREVLTLRDPSSANVAYSPDGRLLATGGSAAGTEQTDVVIWDAKTGKPLERLKGHTSDVSFVAFSPDSSRLVSSAPDGVVVWSMRRGQALLRLGGTKFGRGAATFSPDGTQLVVGVPGPRDANGVAHSRAWILDASTGKPTRPPLKFAGSVCQPPVFSHDGAIIAVPTGDNTSGTPILDVASGRMLERLPTEGAACTVAFSPDDTQLAVATDAGASVWNLRSGHQAFALLGLKGAIGIDWSRDGHLLATGGPDGTARVWDASTGEQLLVLSGIEGIVANVAFSPDGTRLLAGGGDGTARVWDVTPAATSEGIGRSSDYWLNSVSYSPDGSSVVIGGFIRNSAQATVLNAVTGRQATSYPMAERAVYSPDGRTLATDGQGARQAWVEVHDIASGRLLAKMSGFDQLLAFSPDGGSLATQDLGGARSVQVWDAATGELRTTLPFEGSGTDSPVNATFSPDGSLLAGISGLAVVEVWDVSSGKLILRFQGQTGFGSGVAFSSDGTTLAVSGGGGVTLWRLATGRQIATLSTTAGIRALAYSPDGRLLATGGDDGVVRIWDVASRQEILALPGHDFTVSDVAFSPDGKMVASVDQGGRLRTDVLSIHDLVRIAEGRLTRELTTQECQQYLHLLSCSSRATALGS